MGTELQAKYQKLAQEYAKLRSHVDVLKKAIRDEKTQRSALEETRREMSQSLRKHVQENESLEFRNQQLSKRVALLQEEISSPSKKKKKGHDGFTSEISEIHTQELAAKISENERLHMKILELTQRSERKVQGLEAKVVQLEREASTHEAGVEELNREHTLQLDALREAKAMLELAGNFTVVESSSIELMGLLASKVKCAQQTENLANTKQHLQRLEAAASEWRQRTLSGKGQKDQKLSKSSLLLEDEPSFSSLNVPVVDTKLQAEILVALQGGMELITTFTTQLSTFHSYLEQRCKCYPIDASSGLHISTVNLKLSELLHSSSSYTRPLVRALSSYCDKIETNPFSHNLSDDLEDFRDRHHKLVGFLEVLTPYLILSLEEESNESVCGANLTQVNQNIAETFPLLSGAFASVNDYISIIITGQSEGVSSANAQTCLEKLNSALVTLQFAITKLSDFFSSKISLEYQLPTTTQKLNTTNECVISALSGILSTAKQLSGYLESNSEVFESAIDEATTSQAENKQPTQSMAVQNLRVRATNYIRALKHKDCPPSVPYTLAVHNSQSLSTSTESNQSLLQQVSANKEKFATLEQEKEQLALDLKLLTIKYEMEQKKNSTLETDLSRARQQGGVDSSVSAPALTDHQSRGASPSSTDSSQKGEFLVGSMSLVHEEGSEAENSVDDTSLIRTHFVERITDLNNMVQDADSKAAHYYAECRALHKQLSHNTVIRNKLTQDLQSASDSIQQLQDQLATTSGNYEQQLSTMTEHLCEINEKYVKQTDELEILKRSAKGKKRGK